MARHYERVDQLPLGVRGFSFTDRAYAGRRIPSHEWQYIARATDARPQMPVPRGRVVGGSSSINGTVFLRALRNDLDSWAAAGNPEWSFDRCLPFYRQLEIPVSRAAQEDWLAPSEAFFEACTALGYAYCADMNQPDARGVGPIPTNYSDGIQHSSAICYLMPNRTRANLHIFGDTLVTRLNFDGSRARGVEALRDGQMARIEADEVILSAGAIGSPHLLMLSGVGPAAQLRTAGVEPLLDLPGVGQHVRDHPFVATLWDTFEPGATERPTGVPWQLMLRRTAQAEATPQADDGWLTMIMSTAREADAGRGFTIPSSLMYARSTGGLRLLSSEPDVPPLLDFNYLSEPSDLVRLREHARLALEIGHHAAFAAICAGLRQPAADDIATDALFDDWIRRTISTGHHISCTCRMGPATDPTAVVDQFGRVNGVDNLRVIDASIMPDCPSVNLNATVMMMAEKLAASL